jgi:hypothetical protein
LQQKQGKSYKKEARKAEEVKRAGIEKVEKKD